MTVELTAEWIAAAVNLTLLALNIAVAVIGKRRTEAAAQRAEIASQLLDEVRVIREERGRGPGRDVT
jgi:hypothetical protein